MDDDAPELMISGSGSVTEGDNVTANFLITSQVKPSGGTLDIDYTPVSVKYLATSVTGIKVVDRRLFFSGTGPYFAVLPILVDDDDTTETEGRITVTLNQKDPISGYTVTSTSSNQAYIEVVDNDNLPTLSFTTTNFNVEEEVSGGNFEIEVGLDNPAIVQVTFTVAVSNGTATKGADFNDPLSATGTIGVGDSN